MKSCAFNLKNINLYVVRRNSEDKMKSSAPCKACAETLKKCNIKYIIYSNDESEPEALTKIKVKDFESNHVSLGNRFIHKYIPFMKNRKIKRNE